MTRSVELGRADLLLVGDEPELAVLCEEAELHRPLVEAELGEELLAVGALRREEFTGRLTLGGAPCLTRFSVERWKVCKDER
jgi:hypothetical protein